MARNGKGLPGTLVYLGLFGILVIGIGLTIWLGPLKDEELTPAYMNLLEFSDWMMKSSLGAILGFAGSTHLSRRNGSSVD